MEKTKGRKRHIVTDIMGNLLSIVVHAANIHDTKSGGKVFAHAVEKYLTIKGVCADAGYRESFENDVKVMGKSITISEKIKPKGWHILPKRWIEGAFGVLKEDRQFDRFLSRGSPNVTTELLLLCFGYNMNRLHTKRTIWKTASPIENRLVFVTKNWMAFLSCPYLHIYHNLIFLHIINLTFSMVHSILKLKRGCRQIVLRQPPFGLISCIIGYSI